MLLNEEARVPSSSLRSIVTVVLRSPLATASVATTSCWIGAMSTRRLSHVAPASPSDEQRRPLRSA